MFVRIVRFSLASLRRSLATELQQGDIWSRRRVPAPRVSSVWFCLFRSAERYICWVAEHSRVSRALPSRALRGWSSTGRVLMTLVKVSRLLRLHVRTPLKRLSLRSADRYGRAFWCPTGTRALAVGCGAQPVQTLSGQRATPRLEVACVRKASAKKARFPLFSASALKVPVHNFILTIPYSTFLYRRIYGNCKR